MAVNRLLYFGVLILSAVFYFASSLWFSWVLVVLLLAAPIVSLLVSLPAMLSCRFSASIPDTVEQGEKAAMHMTLHAWRVLPLPEVQARLNLRTRDVQKDTRYLSHLSRANGAMALSTETCGFIAPEFRRARVYDALGLFALPVKMPKLEPMVILPPPLQPDPMPRMDQFLQQQMKAKPGGGFSELHDNRPYRPGDLVKDIHWKLSLKTDELIVREAQEPLFRRMVLALRTPRGAAVRSVSLGNLRWLCQWLLEKGVNCKVVWMDGEGLQTAELRTEQDALRILRAVCLAAESSADLPWPLPLQADWICAVGPEGGAGT
ncbi:MAG: DUF58 domain-containing protein [Oscillospiraceae bacterium]|jgi:uncharacterized protein (DUF58 family)|nr:DUF58 domain-containing protein [Oscillospiraceae bacterium]